MPICAPSGIYERNHDLSSQGEYIYFADYFLDNDGRVMYGVSTGDPGKKIRKNNNKKCVRSSV